MDKEREVLGRLDRLEPKVDNLEVKVDNLDAGQKRLEDDVQDLKEGQRRLEDDVQDLKAGQKRLEGHLEFVIERLDQMHEESDRRFGILLEHHRKEKAQQGEGVRANRERLDDHEVRIQDLEAS
jgi:peptidoglycan hydrolase CwlO-like protein